MDKLNAKALKCFFLLLLLFQSTSSASEYVYIFIGEHTQDKYTIQGTPLVIKEANNKKYIFEGLPANITYYFAETQPELDGLYSIRYDYPVLQNRRYGEFTSNDFLFELKLPPKIEVGGKVYLYNELVHDNKPTNNSNSGYAKYITVNSKKTEKQPEEYLEKRVYFAYFKFNAIKEYKSSSIYGKTEAAIQKVQSMKDLDTTYHTTKPIVTVSESPTPALPLKPAKFKSSKP